MAVNGAAIDVNLIKSGRYMTKAQVTTTVESEGPQKPNESDKKGEVKTRNLKTLIRELKEQNLQKMA